MNFLRPIVKKINLKPVEQNLISKPVSEKVVQKPVNEIDIEKPVETNENLKPVNKNFIQKPVKPNVIFKPVNEVIIQKPIEQKKMSKPNKELSENSFTFPDNIIEDIKTSVKLFSDSINNLTNVFRTNALNSESANSDLLKILRFLPQEDVSSEKLSEVLNLLPQFRNKQMNIPKDMINILNNSADLFNNAITTFNDFLNANKIKKTMI
jgi:hypothetical protein